MAGEVEAIDYTHSDGQPSPFPLIRCRNIYVLPGIPELLRSKWKVGHHAPSCQHDCHHSLLRPLCSGGDVQMWACRWCASASCRTAA